MKWLKWRYSSTEMENVIKRVIITNRNAIADQMDVRMKLIHRDLVIFSVQKNSSDCQFVAHNQNIEQQNPIFHVFSMNFCIKFAQHEKRERNILKGTGIKSDFISASIHQTIKHFMFAGVFFRSNWKSFLFSVRIERVLFWALVVRNGPKMSHDDDPWHVSATAIDNRHPTRLTKKGKNCVDCWRYLFKWIFRLRHIRFCVYSVPSLSLSLLLFILFAQSWNFRIAFSQMMTA